MPAKYLDMIVDAIHTLGERKGSSAPAIWKYLQAQYPEALRAQKIFRVQLRRVAQDGKLVEKSGTARYKLTSSLRGKLLRWAAKAEGAEKALPPLALGHAMTTKTTNARKAAARTKRAAMSKSAKGKRRLAKSKKAAASKKRTKTKARTAAKKAKGASKTKSTKAAKAGKAKGKAKGSAASKKRVGGKASKTNAKVAAGKSKNQRSTAASKSKAGKKGKTAATKPKSGARGKAAQSKAAGKAAPRGGSRATSPSGKKSRISVSTLGSGSKRGSKPPSVSRRSKGIKK
jgi:histone H1/5